MIQTRSEINGISNHKTMELALNAARKDNTIWKISFDAKDGFRVRLVSHTKNDAWIYEPIIDCDALYPSDDPYGFPEDPRD